VYKAKRRTEGPPHQELVEHLVRSMEQVGLTIESADAPGYRKPGRVGSGLLRSGCRPDVIARHGRRTIFGVASHDADASKADVRDQLDTLAAKCRMLVICMPLEAADRAGDALFHNPDLLHWRKIRLLRHPDTTWQEAPRRLPSTKRPAFDHAVVRVVENT
jgi:hypothetical protein